MGLVSLAADFGYDLQSIVNSDASAALAIAQRQGLGKLRHIRVQWLWIQEQVKDGEGA